MGHKNLTTRMIAGSLILMVLLSCRLPGILMGDEPDDEAAPTAAVTATEPPEVLAAPTEPAVPTSTPTQEPAAPEVSYAVIDPENAAQLAEVARIGKGYIQTQSWISGGTSLMVGSSLGIHQYDSQSLEEIAFVETALFKSRNRGIFSPDGALLAEVSQDHIHEMTIRVRDVSTTEVIRILEGHTQPIYNMAFSPDGSLLASLGSGTMVGVDFTLRLWDVSSGEQLSIMKTSPHEFHVDFSPDGTALVSQGLDTVSVWDVATGQLLNQREDNALRIKRAAFVPEGILMAARDDDTITISDAISGDLISVLSFTGRVTRVDFSPDGSRLVTGTLRGNLRLWDVSTGQLIQTLVGHAGPRNIASLEFSPDGAWIVSRCVGGLASVWDAATGNLHGRLTQHAGRRVAGAVLTHGGEHLVSAGYEDAILVWDPITGELHKELVGHLDWITSVTYAPNGSLLAVGGRASKRQPDSTFRLWEVSSGQLLGDLVWNQDSVSHLIISPDGSIVGTIEEGSDSLIFTSWDVRSEAQRHRLALNVESVKWVRVSSDWSRLAILDFNNTIHLWDLNAGSPLITLEVPKLLIWATTSLAFSPDGEVLAVGNYDQTIRLYDVVTGELLATLDTLFGSPDSLAYTPDGMILASGINKRTLFSDEMPIIILWEVSSGNILDILDGHMDSIYNMAFSPDGTVLAASDFGKNIYLWDVGSGMKRHILEADDGGFGLSEVFTPDGSRLAVVDRYGKISLWDVNTGQRLQVREGYAGVFNKVAFSPDGALLAIGGETALLDDYTIRLWDAAAGYQLSTPIRYTNSVRGLAISPDGSLLAVMGDDDTLTLWDQTTGERVSQLTGSTTAALHAVFSPDGLLLASGHSEGRIHLWELVSGNQVGTFTGYSGGDLVFSPDGSTLASTGDDVIYLWDIDSGQLIEALEVDIDGVKRLAYSPDGAVLASAGRNHLQLWDIASGQLINTLDIHTTRDYDPIEVGVTGRDQINSLVFSPCGRLLVTGGGDGIVRLWGVPLE